MSHSTLHNTIRSRFDTSVVSPQGLTGRVQYDNHKKFNIEDQLWCRLKVIPGVSETTEIGGSTNTQRTVGLAIVSIFQPLGQGTKDVHELVDAIKTVFRGDPDNNVTYLEGSEDNIGRSGKFWQVNVRIPFRYDVRE